jgi:hypothetical protein
VEKREGRSDDALQEGLLRPYSYQHAYPNQDAEKVAGKFFGRLRRTDRAVGLPSCHGVPEELLQSNQDMRDHLLEGRIMRRHLHRCVDEHATLALHVIQRARDDVLEKSTYCLSRG